MAALASRLPALALLALLGGCGGGTGSTADKPGGGPGGAPPPPQVILDFVRAAATPNVLVFPGRVQAVRTAEVRARVTGIVEHRLYEEGSDVRAGQLLYRIDPLPLKATLAAATGALGRARAVALNAQQDVTRFRPLVAENAISRQEYDAAVARLAQAEADVRSAAAQGEQARLNLGYATVTAPIAGRAGRSLVTEGALASSTAATLLTTIDQLDPIYVNFSQSNAELLALRRRIDRGDLRSAGLAKTRVTLLLEDGTPYEYPGRLNFLDLSVDPTTGGVSLRAQFPNPRRLLLPGEFVRARMEAGITSDAITVPQSAVVLKPEGASVLMLGAGNKVVVRAVTLGPLIGDRWVVAGGLATGERIIVVGLQKARPGTVVAPVIAGAPAIAPAR